MKAALATRPAADTNARLQQLAQLMPKNLTNVEQASGQSKWIRQQIFEGFMLDARVSVTYFCMIGLFVYLVVSVSSPAFLSDIPFDKTDLLEICSHAQAFSRPDFAFELQSSRSCLSSP